MLGIIYKGAKNKIKIVILPPFRTLAYPLLKCSTWFWYPNLQKNIVKLEEIRKRSAKITKAVDQITYTRNIKR